MKKLLLFPCFLLLSLVFASCQGDGRSSGSLAEMKETNPAIYYFHYSRRCATCIAVEEEAQYVADVLYKGSVKMVSVNLDEKEGKELARKMGASGQALLIVKEEISYNITQQAFMYALSDRDRLRKIIREHIDPLL